MSHPTSPLISVDELAGRLDEPGVVVCDVRWYLTDPYRGRREYDEAHVPGAVFVDLHTELAGTVGGGRHPLPTTYEFAAHLSRLGIARDDTVVAYDSAGGAVASRLWWMLGSIGHARASVLDGGYQAWEAGRSTDRPTVVVGAGADRLSRSSTVGEASSTPTTSPTSSRAGRLSSTPARPSATAARSNRSTSRRATSRARSTCRTSTTSTPTATIDPVDELAARFADLGSAPVVYCGSGVTACHDLLAMSIAGITDARLYPGSWSDWSSQPGRPVATGD